MILSIANNTLFNRIMSSESVEKAIELANTLSASPALSATIIQVTQIQVSLSSRQAQTLDQLYDTTKQATKGLLSMDSMSDAMKIGQLMAIMVKLVEKTSYGGEKIPGAEKREIALALGKRLISDPTVIENDMVRSGVSMAYDLLGETMLETLLDVSRHVNTAIQQAAISCCESLLACMKK